MSLFGSGPSDAPIMLVGECYTEEESRSSQAFLGRTGEELNKMLHEAGIMRSECYTTNVVNARPPFDDLGRWIAYKKKDQSLNHRMCNGLYCLSPVIEGIARLQQEIELVNPGVIVAFGNVAMWALTGATGILKWRGSILTTGRKGVATASQ